MPPACSSRCFVGSGSRHRLPSSCTGSTPGEEAAAALAAHCETGASLDPHLPDQLALYLAMCGEDSTFSTSRVTEHLVTNLWTIGLFRKCRYAVEGGIGNAGIVRIT